MDTEDRRYFKQQEITLWRKPDKSRKNPSQHHLSNNPHVPSHLVGGPENNINSRSNILDAYEDDLGAVGGSGQTTSNLPSEEGTLSVENGNTSLETPSMNEDRPLNDSKMGLFTRESPFQETKSDLYLAKSTKRSTSLNSLLLTLPTTTSCDQEMQRGTADGAASSSVQSDVPSDEEIATGSLLFETNSTGVSTTPPSIPSPLQQPQLQPSMKEQLDANSSISVDTPISTAQIKKKNISTSLLPSIVDEKAQTEPITNGPEKINIKKEISEKMTDAMPTDSEENWYQPINRPASE